MNIELPSGISLPEDKISNFCEKWGIVKLEVFGSALTKNFNPDSDIDLLATFDAKARLGLQIFGAADELSNLLSRKIDLVTRQGLAVSRNVYRRNKILSSARIVYDRT